MVSDCVLSLELSAAAEPDVEFEKLVACNVAA